MASLDTLEIFGGTVSGFIKRVLVFLSAGWIGHGLGILASSFTQWSDFTQMPDFGGFYLGPFELMAVFLWPFSQFLLIGAAPFLTVIAMLLTGGMFFAYVYSENEPILWWIGTTLATSALMVRASIGMGAAPPYLVLAIFWAGLLSAGYYFYRRAYPDGFAKAGAILSGQKDALEDDYESVAEMKARLAEEEAAIEKSR